MNRFGIWILMFVLMSACATSAPPSIASAVPSATPTFPPVPPTATLPPTALPTTTPQPLVPNFQHIVIIMFENKEFGSVIGNSLMPNFNRLASEYTLLTQYYAIMHPSL